MNKAILLPLAVTGLVIYAVVAFKIGFALFDFLEERTGKMWPGLTAYLVWMAWAICTPIGLLIEYAA